MRAEIFFILIVCLIACKPKLNSDINNVEPTNTNIQSKTVDEDFSDFFKKFKNDSLFQVQRIDNPLSLIISDEESDEEQKKEVKYVSFFQKDWDVKIKYNAIEISKDTMAVILEGIDTGVHIEHVFAKRGDQWYLFQIKNLSD